MKSLKISGSVSKLKSLNLFLDEHGLIRVGGHLKNASLPYEIKYPFMLPTNTSLQCLSLDHERLMHTELKAILFSLRENYSSIAERNSARKIRRECI